jgi:hypothetical protein
MSRLLKKNIVSETYKFFKFKKGKTQTQSRVLAAEARETGNYPSEVLDIMKHNSNQLATLGKIKKVKKVVPKPDVPAGTQLGLFDKLAGILDSVKDTLANGIWFENSEGYRLRPPVKSYLVFTARKIVPLELVDKIFIIGSITGHKYKETSDVDVNVYLKKEVSKEDVKKYHVQARAFNEKPAPGTKHPVNFYISDFKETAPFKWAKFGVYSVLNDTWINQPTPKEELLDPNVEFHKELNTAKIFTRNFARMADEYAKDLIDYKALMSNDAAERALKSKQNELALDLQRLIDEEQRLHNDREFVYGKGWGVPRTSFRNLLYKLIEHNQYGSVLKQLKSYKHREK